MNVSFERRKQRFVAGGAVGLAAGAALLGALAGCERPPPRVVEVPVPVPGPPEVVRVETPAAKCELPNIAPGAPASFVVEAWGVPDETFYVGEPLRFQMRASSPAYVNVFHVSTSCKVTRLLHDLPVRETQIVDFPSAGSGIRATVKPPAGNEAFYVLATREKADFLAAADLMGGGGVASLDLDPAQFYARLRQAMGRIDPGNLGTAVLRTRIVEH